VLNPQGKALKQRVDLMAKSADCRRPRQSARDDKQTTRRMQGNILIRRSEFKLQLASSACKPFETSA
jgi:hypothetical protein